MGVAGMALASLTSYGTAMCMFLAFGAGISYFIFVVFLWDIIKRWAKKAYTCFLGFSFYMSWLNPKTWWKVANR